MYPNLLILYEFCFEKLYHPFHFMFDITSWTSMFNETVSKDTETLLLSFSLIKHIHVMINWLHYGHWADKRKCMPYISVTRKVLKSCRSKMATWAHDVYDVHEAYLLYEKTCQQSSFIYVKIPTPLDSAPH